MVLKFSQRWIPKTTDIGDFSVERIFLPKPCEKNEKTFFRSGWDWCANSDQRLVCGRGQRHVNLLRCPLQVLTQGHG